MKTKFLKKVRKRFSWRYDHADYESCAPYRWILIDHKKQSTQRFYGINSIANHIIGEILGSYSYFNRIKLRAKREQKLRYNKEIKLLSN